MPVQYSGIVEEHRAVRAAVGCFDVSHMGEFEFRGPDSLRVLQRLTTNDVSTLEVGQVQYSLLCYEDGGIVDDLTLYRLAEDHYMMTVNASNIDKDWAWVSRHLDGRVEARNLSEETGLIAVQGPHAERLVARLSDVDVPAIGYYHFRRGHVAGVPGIISRTGLHRRGRLRAVPAGGPHRGGMGAPLGRRRGGWRGADRARRPGHPQARDEVRALRQRHRPEHESPRGGARLGGEARQGRVRRPAADRGRPRRGAPPSPRRLRDGRASGGPRTATRSSTTARPSAW